MQVILNNKPVKKNRKRLKKEYIYVKNGLRNNTNGANYTTHHYIDEEYEVDGKMVKNKTAWADIYFIDPKTRLMYNTVILTADLHAHDTVEEKALEMAQPLYDQLEGTTIWGTRSEKRETWYEATNRYAREIIEQDDMVTSLDAVIDNSYRWGVGLTLVVDAEYLTVANINQAIEEFLSGEYESCREIKISKDNSIFDWVRGTGSKLHANLCK